MTPIHCRAVLFDMDGVLVDSTPAIARVWTQWALAHGFNPAEVVYKAHGRASIATIRELLPNADHFAEDREVERLEIADVSDVTALPGAARLLQAIPRDRWAIVTSATRPLAEVRLRAAGLPVPKNLVTASDLRHGKPAPDPYLQGAEILGIASSECLVIEDAVSGVRSGKAAGARVLCVRTTSPDGELRRAGADWLVDNLSQITIGPRAPSGELSLLLMTNPSTR